MELIRKLWITQLKFEKEHLWYACQMGRRTKNSSSRPLQLLHMDLFGPTKTNSFGGKQYVVVSIDDFFRFTWVLFLANKDEAITNF